VINFDSFAGTDTRKAVSLRGLDLHGSNTGLTGIRILGAAGSTGSAVFIQDSIIDGFGGNPGRGISDIRAGGGELTITNATVRNSGATSVLIQPATGSNRLDVTADNLRVHNGNIGFAVSNGVRAMVSRSVFSGNNGGGIYGDGLLGAAEMHVSNSVTSNNGIGVQIGGGAITIRLSDTDVAFNGTAFSGPTQSFHNNRVVGNSTLGTAPTLIGSTSNPTGLE
jgi:hypothetical protein